MTPARGLADLSGLLGDLAGRVVLGEEALAGVQHHRLITGSRSLAGERGRHLGRGSGPDEDLGGACWCPCTEILAGVEAVRGLDGGALVLLPGAAEARDRDTGRRVGDYARHGGGLAGPPRQAGDRARAWWGRSWPACSAGSAAGVVVAVGLVGGQRAGEERPEDGADQRDGHRARQGVDPDGLAGGVQRLRFAHRLVVVAEDGVPELLLALGRRGAGAADLAGRHEPVVRVGRVPAQVGARPAVLALVVLALLVFGARPGVLALVVLGAWRLTSAPDRRRPGGRPGRARNAAPHARPGECHRAGCPAE